MTKFLLPASRRAALVAAAAMCITSIAIAQTLPQQMSLMIPYPAGGVSDAIGRILAPAIAKELGGKTLIVDNLGGSGGGVAAMKTLNARSDGGIIFQGSPNELILAPLVNEELTYKPEQFRLITRITQNPLMVLVKNDLPVQSFDELIAYAKVEAAKGKSLNYGSVGVGSMYHILTEEIASRVGTKFTHVPYKGGAPLLQDMMGGVIDFTILPYQSSYKGMQDQKKLRMLAWVLKEPAAFVPTLATTGQSMTLPGFERDIWAGFYVKADTPEPIVQTLHKAIAAAMSEPAVQARLTEIGSVVPKPQDLTEASRFHAAEARELLGFASKVDLRASK